MIVDYSIIKEIHDYLEQVHSENAFGCKSSCDEREVGHHQSTYHESYWYARFGGYCLGDLTRRVEIKADSLKELLLKTKLEIEEAIKRSDDFIENEYKRE